MKMGNVSRGRRAQPRTGLNPEPTPLQLDAVSRPASDAYEVTEASRFDEERLAQAEADEHEANLPAHGDGDCDCRGCKP